MCYNYMYRSKGLNPFFYTLTTTEVAEAQVFFLPFTYCVSVISFLASSSEKIQESIYE